MPTFGLDAAPAVVDQQLTPRQQQFWDEVLTTETLRLATPAAA